MFRIRKADLSDVPDIYQLLKHMAGRELLLPRSLSNLYEMVQTFQVAENEDGQVVGAVAIQVAWEALAEVRSLAVREEFGGLGLGRQLTRAVEEEGLKLGVERMFVLTFAPVFFESLGYSQIPLGDLPQKIWAVCFQCIHYPDCRETALMRNLVPNPRSISTLAGQAMEIKS